MLRRLSTPRFAVVVVLAAAVLAASCQLVGSGDLHVQNDLSGLGEDNTTFEAFVADPGDAWPPPGELAIWVKGDDFGSPPDYGMDGFLYVVRTELECPMSEGAPEVFELTDVDIVGVASVRDGSVNQFFTMPDSSANRDPRWALIEIGTVVPDGHLIHRCGTVTWNP